MAESVADLTLAHVRKIDQTVSRIWEALNRHDTRMGRVERDLLELKRDIGELKNDQILMENRLLNRMTRSSISTGGLMNMTGGWKAWNSRSERMRWTI